MHKPTKKSSKLELNMETVRVLISSELTDVVGGNRRPKPVGSGGATCTGDC